MNDVHTVHKLAHIIRFHCGLQNTLVWFNSFSFVMLNTFGCSGLHIVEYNGKLMAVHIISLLIRERHRFFFLHIASTETFTFRARSQWMRTVCGCMRVLLEFSHFLSNWVVGCCGCVIVSSANRSKGAFYWNYSVALMRMSLAHFEHTSTTNCTELQRWGSVVVVVKEVPTLGGKPTNFSTIPTSIKQSFP